MNVEGSKSKKEKFPYYLNFVRRFLSLIFLEFLIHKSWIYYEKFKYYYAILICNGSFRLEVAICCEKLEIFLFLALRWET